MAILRYGPMGGVVFVRTTASRGHPHIVPPSHTCPPCSLEQSLAAPGGDWLLRMQQGRDWLLKTPEASTPRCRFSGRLLLSICQRSPGPFQFQVRSRGPSSSWTQVKIRAREVIAARTCSRKSPRRGFASVGSAAKSSAPRQI